MKTVGISNISSEATLDRLIIDYIYHLNYSAPTLIRCIKKLEKTKFINTQKRYGKKRCPIYENGARSIGISVTVFTPSCKDRVRVGVVTRQPFKWRKIYHNVIITTIIFQQSKLLSVYNTSLIITTTHMEMVGPTYKPANLELASNVEININ